MKNKSITPVVARLGVLSIAMLSDKVELPRVDDDLKPENERYDIGIVDESATSHYAPACRK